MTDNASTAIRACTGSLALLLLWGCSPSPQAEADKFLTTYEDLLQGMYPIVAESFWKSSTDVTDSHVGERIGAEQVMASITGNPWVIETARQLLASEARLDDAAERQLRKILLAAAEYPGTIPEIVAARVAAEAEQGAILDSFEFCAERSGELCAEVVTPNQIDRVLAASTDESERRKIWEVAKQTGPALKPGIGELRDLRNQVAQEMGYDSFFALQVADYGMSVDEMMAMMERFVADLRPLYEQLHTWAKHELAQRYKQPVPDRIPAHWIGNRWAQAWPGLSRGVDLDGLVAGKEPEWIVRQAEAFYKSLGMPALPRSFYDKSDLYPLPPGSERKKNTHASAWHMDLGSDVRSLMSVENNWRWFETSHHELGHVYYYMAYSRPEVPLVLREGANRAFHEAIGDLIGIASRQPAYLKEIGLLGEDEEIDEIAWLLDEALDQAVVFIPFAAGTMTFFERDLYESDLPVGEFNQRWWEHAGRFQGIQPPGARGEDYCDACTKTHITDDPAQYYDYAMAFVIKYQLHTYIANNILGQDPRNCNYYGSEEVGEFLWDLLRLGATRDWREVMLETTGSEVSTEAMLDYFAPLVEHLRQENEGREIGW
ncbi:MAG: M2 family metallopeptidase [Bryobacterales bacterium]|nr:M2 family metallopeptidase [Bryobacterales bacterium]